MDGPLPHCTDHTIHLYSAKGGQGCTVTTAHLAILAAQVRPIVVADRSPGGDLDAALGGAVANVTIAEVGQSEQLACDLIDWGTRIPPAELPGRRLLVTTACYLALRRHTGHRPPDGIILLDEPERALRPADITAVLRAPIVAHLPRDPRIASAVDAGLAAVGRPAAAKYTSALQHVLDTTTTTTIHRQPQRRYQSLDL